MFNNNNKKSAIRFLTLFMICCLIICGIHIDGVTINGKTKNVTGISLKIGHTKVTKKTYKIKVGDKKKLTLQVIPGKAKKNVKYFSTNKKVAVINQKGVITAKKRGTSKITVTVAGKNYKKKTVWVKVQVMDPSQQKIETSDTLTQPVITQEPATAPVQSTAPSNVPRATETPEPNVPSGKKNVVVYFSCTDNTKRIAEYIAESQDADIYRIEPAVPYTEADLNYNDTNSRTSKENRDTASRPAILGELPLLDEYTNIYIGYPIWHGQAPKILYTFVQNYNLSEKTVIPFCTSASSGIGTSAVNLQNAANWQSTWLVGKRFSGSAPKSDVADWIVELGVN